jgi:hypothetical protein
MAFTQPVRDRLTAIRGEINRPKDMKASIVITREAKKGSGYAMVRGRWNTRAATE